MPTTNDALEIKTKRLEADDLTGLSVTLNICRKGLECLTDECKGAKYWSKDKPSNGETKEQVQEQIAAVYSKLSRKPPGEMASLAARTACSFRRDKYLLGSYGDIVLVMNWEEIASDIVIFNGDVKNLGAKLVDVSGAGGQQADWFKSFAFDEGPLTGHITSANDQLNELWARTTARNQTPPRIVGSYCEARLFRALRPTDVSKVFIPEDANAEMYLIEELERLIREMRAHQ